MTWDQYDTGSNWVTFNNIGDEIVGTIKEIRVGSDYRRNPCPELILETDNGLRTLTVGQTLLKARLIELAPEVGDRIKIVYTGNGEAKAGKNPPKQFQVGIKSGIKPAGQLEVEKQLGATEEPFE